MIQNTFTILIVFAIQCVIVTSFAFNPLSTSTTITVSGRRSICSTVLHLVGSNNSADINARLAAQLEKLKAKDATSKAIPKNVRHSN